MATVRRCLTIPCCISIIVFCYAQLYHETKETHKAIEVLSNALEMHPECVDEELINILAELCIMTKTYQQVYDVGLSVVISLSLLLSLSMSFSRLRMYM